MVNIDTHSCGIEWNCYENGMYGRWWIAVTEKATATEAVSSTVVAVDEMVVVITGKNRQDYDDSNEDDDGNSEREEECMQ